MKAYLVRVNQEFYPFSKPASEVVFNGVTLRQRLEGQLKKAGLQVVHVDADQALSVPTSSLVIQDDVIISDNMIKKFLKAVKGKKCHCQLNIDVSRFPMMTPKEYPAEYRRMPIFYCASEYKGTLSALCEEVAGVTLSPKAPLVVVEGLPARMHELKNLEAHFVEYFAIQLRYWFDLQVATTCYCSDFVAKLAARADILPEAISHKLFSWTWLKEKTNIVGKNSNIHPTAVLEGCVVGDNVEIGPYAYLRSSVIADNAVIRERSTIKLSYIGEGAYIVGSDVLNCYVGAESSIITPMLFHVVFGTSSFISGGSGFADFNAGSAKVTACVGPEEEVPSGLHYLGSCVGDNCFIGANMIFAPGRVIPNGTKLLDHGLLKNLPKESDNTYVLSGDKFIQIPKNFFTRTKS